MKFETNGLVGTDWQCVDHLDYDPGLGGYAEEDFVKRWKWCLSYDGLGSFYADSNFGLFYFERDEDREMFLLRWS